MSYFSRFGNRWINDFRKRKPQTDLATRASWLDPFRWIAACKILAFPLKLKHLRSLNFMRPYFPNKNKRDTFFFLTHDYYLSKAFTLAQRVDCAINHYSFEGQNYGPTYHRSVYHSPRGLALWHRVIDGTNYSINLRATEDYRYEGDLSILCFVDDTRICRVSFSYVDGRLFGLKSERTMFVTRNQTDRSPELQRFRDCFKQNSPPYFCLASVCGIAMANGMRAIFMVKDDAQIAYQERYAAGFRSSYSALWEAFGAQQIDDRRAYRMSIPPKLTPVSIVKHKKRAVARRNNWLEIAMSTRQAMLEHRTSRVPRPIDGEAIALLPHANQQLLTADAVHGAAQDSHSRPGTSGRTRTSHAKSSLN
jgi:uncharacterized protein VirK/YbjX